MWTRLLRCQALPTDRFEEAYPRSHRGIQALDLALHRDTYQQVAGLARQAPHSRSLRTQYPGNGLGDIRFKDALFRLLVRTDDPDIPVLQIREGTGQVRDHEIGRD